MARLLAGLIKRGGSQRTAYGSEQSYLLCKQDFFWELSVFFCSPWSMLASSFQEE